MSFYIIILSFLIIINKQKKDSSDNYSLFADKNEKVIKLKKKI